MKIKILFVQDSLDLAGSEKSLVSLLRNLNSEKYAVDLQLFKYGGVLEEKLPEWVTVLPPLGEMEKLQKSLLKQFLSIRNRTDLGLFKGRMQYSLFLRKINLSHSLRAQKFWEFIGRFFSVSKKKYDVAIGFAQGTPTFYAMDKVLASKKLCWINAFMSADGNHKDFLERYYSQFDKVVCITGATKNVIKEQIPTLSNLMILENIVDYQEIIAASIKKTVSFTPDVVNILTVGRLNSNSKGIDIAIKAALLLKNNNQAFHWYFLGDGPYKEEMLAFIKTNQLEGVVSLLGTDDNPYPYFRACDIYVQTSRKEGFGRTLMEARLLNKPIVTTRFDAVFHQMKHEQNGLVVDINANAVADGIEKLMYDQELYALIESNLKQEEKENIESVKQFDALIDGLLFSNS